jgi:predicted NACHT family NTPase
MARRSLQTSRQGIQIIKKTLKQKNWSQTYLAGAVGCSRQTIWSLLQGNATDCDVFMEVCDQLGLNWEEIAEPESLKPQQDDTQDIDALVQEVREQIQPYIQERCGTMRVLDMTQPVALGEIYTSVNILERIMGRRGLELAELMRDTSPEKFERFCLGDVREKRVPGLKAVETFSKLMILGKPGAGKTTFMKHLAIQCIGGEFQGDRVPVFITLKDFAEADGKPDLLGYISRLVVMVSVGAQGLAPLQPNVAVIQEILCQGRALILLDGLDEVRDTDSNRVLRQIREFSQHFSQNQFVITCRIAAREYTFEQFTEVEIADFNDEQIADFSGKWFRSKNDLVKAERFQQRLKQDAPIRELATSPLLLTLLCLVFEDSGSFPTNRAELYENGVDVLLKKWDVKRNIERDQVYKGLSLKRKEDLLSQIARTTFEAGNYFFKQREVERYISQYIQNLPDASTNPEALELDSAAVLKSIEAQHGLFVERARGIYSFSHLTFHEYFTARKIVTSCNPYTADDPIVRGLVNHLTEKSWREVFLLTAGMLDDANAMLQLMKAQIDELLAGDEKLQRFLYWLSEKAQLIQLAYKSSAIRAFYLEFAFENGLYLSYTTSYEFERSMCKSILAFGIDPNLAIDICPIKYSESDKAINIDTSEPSHALALDIEIGYIFYRNFDCSVDSVRDVEDLKLHIGLIINSTFDSRLRQKLQALSKRLPSSQASPDFIKRWWFTGGQVWADQLRAVMIEQRNLGHDWQFSDAQKERLQQYYDANKLLVVCLNSDCYVSREVRQEIEETLLLPIAQIKKYP